MRCRTVTVEWEGAPPAAARVLRGVIRRLPGLDGELIRLKVRPALTASRGRLLSGHDAGTPVHAGSFIRKRLMVIDEALLRHPRDLRRIFVHELFHFVWARLGNPARRAWEALLEGEMRGKAAGELGWSAELRKRELTVRDRRERSRPWREYACESFCDTAAWLFCGGAGHGEFTLPSALRQSRREWFCGAGLTRRIPV